jgi:hypothetical protein
MEVFALARFDGWRGREVLTNFDKNLARFDRVQCMKLSEV